VSLSHYYFFLQWLMIDFLRVNMCTLATEQASQWLMVDPWEAFLSYQRTAVVLDHFDYEVNTVLGGAQLPSSPERRHIRPVLLAGSDLISTMSEPGVWSEKDVSPNLRTQLGDIFTCRTSWTTSWESTARSS
jgi:nicotinic acid mononucleotide adenylyltransferase